MALIGLPEYKDKELPVAPEIPVGKKVEKITTNTAKTAMWLDKTKENTVIKSGLLTSKDFTVKNDLGASIDIFGRRPMPSSGDTIFHDVFDLGKGAFTGSAYDRIQVNKEALEVFDKRNPGKGVQVIGDLLTEKGFKESQIKDILGENSDKWFTSTQLEQKWAALNQLPGQDFPGTYDPNTFRPGAPGTGATAPNIPGLNQSPVFDVDKFPEDFGPGYGNQLSNKLQNSQGPITNAPKSNDALNSLNELIRDKFTATKESLKGAGFFPADTTVGGHVPGKVDIPSLTKLGNTASGLSADAGNVMGTIMKHSRDIGSRAGGFADDVLSYGGKAEGLLGKIGQVGGIYKAGKGVTELFQEGERYQGVEDIVQGAIAFASPALLAAGPVGWTVLGLSALEDLFLEDIIDFDWG